MKRDLDIVRGLLIAAERADAELDVLAACDGAIDPKLTAFHVELMREHGLVDAEVSYDGLLHEPTCVTISRITWRGYDYLDAIRSSKVWKKAKDAISKAVGDTSLSVVKETCDLLALSMVKTQLNI